MEYNLFQMVLHCYKVTKTLNTLKKLCFRNYFEFQYIFILLRWFEQSLYQGDNLSIFQQPFSSKV